MLPIILAVCVAGGILLLVVGLTSGSPVDPVQARLTQLGSVQARNLEEMELQLPFSERTLRPLVGRISRMGGRLGSASSTDVAEKRLAMAGNPGDLRVTDWMGVKILVGIATGAIMFLLFGLLVAGLVAGVFLGMLGFGIGFLLPEFWLGGKIKARQKIILKMIRTRSTCLPSPCEPVSVSMPHLPRWSRSYPGHSRTSFAEPWPKCASARPAETRSATWFRERTLRLFPPSSAPSSRPNSWASRSPRCSRSSPISCGSNAVSAQRRWRPKRRLRCSSRSLAAFSLRS